MIRHIACALVLAALSLPALAQAGPAPTLAPAPASISADAPTQIVIEGRRPGPGVWKVGKDGHVLWLFGLYSPLPKKLEWDDARVERLVKQSQEVLMPPNLEVGISGFGGFLRGLTALPSLIGLEKNPGGATLHEVLPADVHARWTVLKDKYIGNDAGIERVRPIFAADRLLAAGLDKNGLANNGDIVGRIGKLAEANKVKQTHTGIRASVDDPRKLVADFKASQIEDLSCFTKTLDGLDSDIAAMRLRARAWADGNIAEINKLDFAERDTACAKATMDSAAIKNLLGYDNVRERVRLNWLQTAEKSLADNASTFAVLQLKDLLGPEGALAVLQAKGYTVESPK